jgi:bacteriorhodopsin
MIKKEVEAKVRTKRVQATIMAETSELLCRKNKKLKYVYLLSFCLFLILFFTVLPLLRATRASDKRKNTLKFDKR